MSRVLVVDNDHDFRQMLCDVLDAAGYDVTEAEHGLQGLERLAAGEVHLVITDILMPGLDGLGLVREMRHLHRHIPIIAISAGGNCGKARCYLDLARGFGAAFTLRKPFDMQVLLRSVATLAPSPQGTKKAGDHSFC